MKTKSKRTVRRVGSGRLVRRSGRESTVTVSAAAPGICDACGIHKERVVCSSDQFGAGIPPQFRTRMGWAETLLWKICDAYWCRRKLGIGWCFAWQHAEAHVEQGWHLEMTPKQAAQEEAYAWAADC